MPEEVSWENVDGDDIPVSKIYENSKVREALQQDGKIEDLSKEVTVPHVIEDAILMSPGTWNGVKYNEEVIKQGLQSTDWEDAHNRALFWDHEDEDSQTWIGEVKNLRMEGEDIIGDLVIVDKNAAIKLEYGAHFGISPKVTGRAQNRVMKSFEFDNFSVVLNPAIKTTWLNSEDERPRMKITEVRMNMSEQEDGRHEEFEEHISTDEFQEKVKALAQDDESLDGVVGMLADAYSLSEEDVRAEIEDAVDLEAENSEESDESDAEAEEEEMSDIDAIADKVLERIEAQNDEDDAEADEADEEEAEEEAEEEYSDGDVEEFQSFVSEMKQEHPDMSYSKIVEKYEEAQMDPAEKAVKAMSERINELEDKLEKQLESQVEEMSEKAVERVSAKTGKADEQVEEMKEKVQEMSAQDLDKAMADNFKRDYERGRVTLEYSEGEAA